MARRDPVPEVGMVYAAPAGKGGFGACQLVGSDDGNLDVVALSWRGEHAPKLAQLRRSKPLTLTHHAHDGGQARVYVDGPPPPEFVALGVLPPKLSGKPQRPSYSGWEWVAIQIAAEAAWKRQPKRARDAYKRCHRDGPGDWRVSVGSEAHCTHQASPDEPFDWSQLDELGCLTELDVYGDLPGLLEYAATRPLLKTLRWHRHGRKRIDASGLTLDELAVTVPEAGLRLVLGELNTLALLNHGKVSATHPQRGEDLELELRFEAAELPPPIAGLSRLSSLQASAKTLDLRQVTQYSRLRTLRLDAQRGAATHLDALRKLKQLTRFELNDCYDFDPKSLPPSKQMPNLACVELDGFRKTLIPQLRQHWEGLPRLELRGAKTDAWLEANIDNPFNSWVDHHPSAVASKAATAYRKSLTRLRKLSAPKPAALKKEVRLYMAVFNDLDRRVGLDTVDREQVWEALQRLFSTAGIATSSDQLGEWFDEALDF